MLQSDTIFSFLLPPTSHVDIEEGTASYRQATADGIPWQHIMTMSLILLSINPVHLPGGSRVPPGGYRHLSIYKGSTSEHICILKSLINETGLYLVSDTFVCLVLLYFVTRKRTLHGTLIYHWKLVFREGSGTQGPLRGYRVPLPH